jgi:hypothetical protein
MLISRMHRLGKTGVEVMSKIVVVSSLVIGLIFGVIIVPVSAASMSGHSMSSSGHGAAFRHHHARRFYPYAPYYYYGYGYGYDDSTDYVPPPATKPAPLQPAAEARRGCEPQSYTVPSANGGESQVTILRC